MKKQMLNLGKALNKAEQKQINGGGRRMPEFPPISYCTVYPDQSTCEAQPGCVWGDWSFEGNGINSCNTSDPTLWE